MGIRTVAVYSAIDQDSLHVSQADEAYCIGEVELSETYLNMEKIIDTAKRAGCDAIHPGYGFLAENPLFVEACDQAGIIFIGPAKQRDANDGEQDRSPRIHAEDRGACYRGYYRR